MDSVREVCGAKGQNGEHLSGTLLFIPSFVFPRHSRGHTLGYLGYTAGQAMEVPRAWDQLLQPGDTSKRMDRRAQTRSRWCSASSKSRYLSRRVRFYLRGGSFRLRESKILGHDS